MIPILYEDPYIIAINKPSGMISEVNPFEAITAEGEVLTYLSKTSRKPFVGVIHRLDKVTSGVMIFAKKKSALVAFNKMFELKTIQKTYHALTNNVPELKEGLLSHHLLKHQKEKIATIESTANEHTKLAELHYKCLQSSNPPYLIELKPKTGRFHQIRAQLAHLNCSIIGDLKYGSTISYKAKGIGLHAYALYFKHPLLPLKKKLLIQAPYPEEKIWLDQA